MAEQRRGAPRSHGASIALAVLGAVLALVGGFLLYARQEIFEPDNLADNARRALEDDRTRLAIAQPIVDGIVDSGSGELVNARPLIESIVVSALASRPAKAAFTEAVKAIDTKLANRAPNTLLLNLTDATVVAARALDALSPQLGGKVPKEIDNVKTAILDSEITITPLHWIHQIDLFGILLPILAILFLVASVGFAPSRRRAVQRAGIAVAAAAVVGVVILVVGRSLALAQIADPLYRDAASATWDALLGGLFVWTVGIGVLSLLLAAAARFGAAEIDPLEPLLRAAVLARTHPARPFLGVLRGLAIGAVGVWFVLAPLSALSVLAVLVGAWLVYVAIVELLGILAPVEAGAGDGRARRRLRPMRLAIAGSFLVAVLVAVLVVGGEHRGEARPLGPPEACNGYPQLCHKRIDQVTFPATHNSMSAAAEPGWFLPNQRYGIVRQLDDGIRALLIDTHYGVGKPGRELGSVVTDLGKEDKTREEITAELGAETVARAEDLIGRLAFGEEPQGNSEPFLCHVLCELGATDLDVALTEIHDWMATHPDEFLVIVIEDVVSPEETAQAFRRAGLLRWAYAPDPGAVGPTLGQLIERDKRLLVMAENDNGGGKYPWYQDAFSLMQETPYTFNSRGAIAGPKSCRPNRGNPDNPLFQMNNWIETVPRDPRLQGEINAKKVLLRRAAVCNRVRGLEPNVIAVDYYNEGDVLGAAKELNGIPAGEKPTYRTTPR
jgi:hypothetical protein